MLNFKRHMFTAINIFGSQKEKKYVIKSNKAHIKQDKKKLFPGGKRFEHMVSR